MTKTEIKNQTIELFNQVNTMYPATYNSAGEEMTRVVEYKGVKYELMYFNSILVRVYKNGNNCEYTIYRIEKDMYSLKEYKNCVSILKNVLKATEIQDGPVLQVVENNKNIPYYSATVRFECDIDAQRMIGIFANLNNWSLKHDNGYMVVVDEYKGKKTSMGSCFAKLSISSDYDINDVKAILLNFEEQLPDCHVAIQSLDYAQFDGLRDRSSHSPTDDLVKEWSNKLNNLKKVA